MAPQKNFAGGCPTEARMHYIKKICILKQVAAGFAADGKTLSALLTAETFGGRLTAALSPIGLAPLSAGRYRAVLCDAHGTAELFDLPSPAGGTIKRASALELTDGLGCALVYVNVTAKAVAFGASGEHTFDLKKMCALADETPPAEEGGGARAEAGEGGPPYDDEAVATENYFAFADAKKEDDHAQTGGACGEAQTDGRNAGEDEDAQSLFYRTGSEDVGADAGAGYYDTVKGELDGMFAKHPAEEELAKSIPSSRWAKIEFAEGKYYVVGTVSEEGRVKYICYGVPAQKKGDPPEALKKWCSYLPLSVFDLGGKGYWMMFQDAVTGVCVKIEQA